MLRIAINGFGRIGKTLLRILMQNNDALSKIKVVAINVGPANPSHIAFQFKYDTILKTFTDTVNYKDGYLEIKEHRIKIFAEPDPSKIDWKTLDIDWVIEASGRFTKREKASLHLTAGAKKVLITAPAENEDITIIPGVNDSAYNPQEHKIISLGSCTTNCFAPIIKVLDSEFEILEGMMTTVHAYTNNQVLLDLDHKDLRRSRSAANNIIPTDTGAAKVITKIFPHLNGKLQAKALRVPICDGSIVDFTFIAKKEISADKINNAFKKYSEHELKNILTICEEPLVSSDFIGDSSSCIIDSLLTQSVDKMGKVFGWYDNEFGYSSRLKDFLLHNT